MTHDEMFDRAVILAKSVLDEPSMSQRTRAIYVAMAEAHAAGVQAGISYLADDLKKIYPGVLGEDEITRRYKDKDAIGAIGEEPPGYDQRSEGHRAERAECNRSALADAIEINERLEK